MSLETDKHREKAAVDRGGDAEESVQRRDGAEGSERSVRPDQPDQPDRSDGADGAGRDEAPAESRPEEPEAEKKPNPPLRERWRDFHRRHPQGVILGAVLAVAVLIGGYFLLRYLHSYESTDDAEVNAHLSAVGSRISGYVTAVYVDNNQTVLVGQQMVQIDPSDYQNAMEQARANYRNAIAQLHAENPNVPITVTTTQTNISTGQQAVATEEAGLLAAQQEYSAREADLRRIEANNAKAQRDVIRYQGLVEKNEISREQYDAIASTAKAEAAGVQSARAAANAAKRMVEQRESALQEAQMTLAATATNAPRTVSINESRVQGRLAAIAAAKAQLDQAVLDLSYTKILAPVAGVIAQRSVEVGEMVEPGQQLLVISQIGDVWITANFKETQIRRMRPGQAVDIHVDAFKRKYRGYVESLPGATGAKTSLLPPENATGNYVKVVQRLPVRIRLKPGEDQEHRLRPGMSVEPKVWVN